MSLVTYHITSDHKDILRGSAKLACSFWNYFLEPKQPIVIRLGTFSRFGNTIARAYRPYSQDGVRYGVVEFNKRYLNSFDEEEIVGTLIHEIAHTLGMGWDKWMQLFSATTGKFHKKYVRQLPELKNMLVETDYGPGTTLSHWDESRFDQEIMSGFKDDDEYVLPVTVNVFELLGHTIVTKLNKKIPLRELLDRVRGMQFSSTGKLASIDRTAYIETELWEEIYENKRTKAPMS